MLAVYLRYASDCPLYAAGYLVVGHLRAEDGAAVEDEGAEDEEEQEEEMYEDPDELPQEYPDPFHDLFGDIRGDALVESQAQGHGGRVRGGSGQGSRGSAGRDVMPRQGARGTQRATTG